jgi:hypothetical protein
MIRETFAGPLFHWAARLLDESIPASELRSFLARSLERAETAFHSNQSLLPLPAPSELALARRLATEAGIPANPSTNHIHLADTATVSSDDLRKWLGFLPEGKLTPSKGISVGTGDILLALLDSHLPEATAFLQPSLETLLRHVETRRKDCLPLSPPGPAEAAWMEKHAFAILFARTSRHQRDLRFLNAAMKMNDWAYPGHRRLPVGPRLVRYLLALAEQERSATEGLS